MEIPSIEAIQAVKEFADNLEVQRSILLYLSEIPIGDEYEVLSVFDRENGSMFEVWSSEMSICLWERYDGLPEKRKIAAKMLDDEFSRVKKAMGK